LDGKTNPRKHNIQGPRRHDIAMHDLLNSIYVEGQQSLVLGNQKCQKQTV